MSAPEAALAALVVVAAVLTLRGPQPWLVLAVTVGSIALAVVGTPRWQLVPAALALALLVGITVLAAGWPDAPRTLPRVTAAAVVLGVATSAALAWVLPIPSLTLEPGSATIGTVVFDLTDPTRTSPSGRTAPDTPRTTPVRAWYPTSAQDGPLLRVTDEPRAFAEAASSFLGLPAFALGHLGAVRTSAIVDAPVDAPAEGLPVVLSLHGWGGFALAQGPLLEQLAADGHLVLTIEHTHAALAAQPAAGGVVPLDPQLLPDDVPPPVYDAAATLLERTFADDAHALLDAIRAGDSQVPDEVVAAADLDRLVVLGHSTGGGGAFLLCAEGAPCRGLVGFDPWLEPVPEDLRVDGFPVPALAISSDEWTDVENTPVLRDVVARSEDVRHVVVEGTKHRDVTVEGLLSPLATRLGISGELGTRRTHELSLQLTRAAIAAWLGTGPGDPALLTDLPPDVVPAG